ncbi:C40 family peptidase [Zooshikella sp. RANM57]|uniref:C40 family peptidase n=1 Tax=Zooshikella sp. RANM57 TaxID=3425863 RepID=UPI003D6E21EC
MFDLSIETAIQHHAHNCYPQESCGFVIENYGYYPCKNIAEDPKNTFLIAVKEQLAAEKIGKIVAVVHSHPDGPDYPSEADMAQQVASGLAWGIVYVSAKGCNDVVWFGDSAEKAPLISRGFRHGVTDCYALIRDWYLAEKNISLKEFPRSWDWWNQKQNLYLDGLKPASFIIVDESEIQIGDVFLAQIRSDVPNHGGIYLGNGLILHHLAAHDPVDLSRLSVREPVYRWKKFITHWIRYVEKN